MSGNPYASRLRALAEQTCTPWLSDAAAEIDRLESELAQVLQALAEPEDEPQPLDAPQSPDARSADH